MSSTDIQERGKMMSDASVSREECENMIASAPNSDHRTVSRVMIPRLARAHLELLAEVEELRRDKERLDWLEKMPILEKFQVTLNHPTGTKPWWIVKRHWQPEGSGNSVREAIDAAMLPDPPEAK